jgi:hypothetical protein
MRPGVSLTIRSRCGRRRDPCLIRGILPHELETSSRHQPHQPGPASLGRGVTTARIAIDMDRTGRPRGLEEGVNMPPGAASGVLLMCPLGTLERGMNGTQRRAVQSRRVWRARCAARHRNPDPGRGGTHRRPRTGRPPPATAYRTHGLTVGNVRSRYGGSQPSSAFKLKRTPQPGSVFPGRMASRDGSARDRLGKETKSAPHGEGWKMQASASARQDTHTCRIVETWRLIAL